MIQPDHVDAIIFDFDGVLTDDKVYVDQDGRETVCCTRKDGIGFDLLRPSGIKLFIVSTERNPVVSRRGEKLKITVLQDVPDKVLAIRGLAATHGFSLERALFVGNDVNDLLAMRACGMSACPADAHPLVRAGATIVLASTGGNGVAREIAESVLKIDPLAKWRPQSADTASES